MSRKIHIVSLYKPDSVKEVEEYLKKCESNLRARELLNDNSKIWYRLATNPPVTSCKDAADKRMRLGHQGIPLWDELKSLVYEYKDGNQTKWVAAHLRGDRQIKKESLSSVLGVENNNISLRSENKVDLSILKMGYRIINPFLLAKRHEAARENNPQIPSIVNVIDEDLLRPTGPPGTVMTNAGDSRWSIEFDPDILEKCLGNTRVGAISIPESNIEGVKSEVRKRKTIGIITGNNPESGSLLWELINKKIRVELNKMGVCRGDISLPRTYIHSLPEMGLSMELDKREEQVWKSIEESMKQLCNLNMDILAIACNTTQYYVKRIRELIKQVKAEPNAGYYGEKQGPIQTEFLSIPECIAQVLKAHNVNQVALIGISYVSEEKYSAYLEAIKGVDIEMLGESEAKLVYKLAIKVKERGADASFLATLNQVFKKKKSKYIIVALTEISLLLAMHKKYKKPDDKVIIDPLVVYAEAIACSYLHKQFPDPHKTIEDYIDT